MIGQYFRIRASSCHSIMGKLTKGSITANQAKTVADYESREKLTDTQAKDLARLKAKRDAKPELPQGAKTLCEQWMQNFKYQRYKSFGAKQTEKGTRTEDDGIELLREYLQDPFLPKKNEWRVVGEFIEGECDLHYLPMVYDIKSCYTHAGMDLYATEPIKSHHDQLQCYAHLFGAKRLGLTKVLCNMPEDMIESEAHYATKAEHGPDYTEQQKADMVDKLTRRYTYDDLPIEMRVHNVVFDFDPAFIEQVIERVKMCREYIDKKFSELPEEKRTPVLEYVTNRKGKAHYADVKRTEERAREWRAVHWNEAVEKTLTPPELAQKEVA